MLCQFIAFLFLLQVILYEKANLQDQMLRAGEEELRKRQEEIRAVQLDITDIR